MTLGFIINTKKQSELYSETIYLFIMHLFIKSFKGI